MRKFFLTTMMAAWVASPAYVLAQDAANNQQLPILPEAVATQDIEPFKDDAPLIALRIRDATAPLEIASIFYKKIGHRPDFKRWAEHSRRYREAGELDKKEVFLQEYNKIVQSFREIKEDAVVTVRSKVYFGEYSELQSIQKIDAFNKDAFFKYDAAGDYFGIIPNGLERFKLIYLEPDRRKAMIAQSGGSNAFVAEIALKINRVDAREPLDIKGYPFWLMLADIVEIRIWAPDLAEPRLLWRYQAENYEPEENVELMKLYDEVR